MGWLIALILILLAAWLVSWALARRTPRGRPAPTAPRPPWFPPSYDLENPGHVVLIDEIRENYAAALARDRSEFADLAFKPASTLPYPKEEIRKALRALLEFAEGDRDSSYLDRRIRRPAVVETLRASLLQLDTFLDAPAEEIPREARANVEFGFRKTRGEG